MRMELIFVYNAESDPLSVLTDYAHKMLSPSTYRCDLCALTHHNFGERKAWKTFRKETNVQLSFYYVEQFEREFGRITLYPAVFEKRKQTLHPLINAEDLSQIKDVEQLISKLKSYIALNH